MQPERPNSFLSRFFRKSNRHQSNGDRGRRGGRKQLAVENLEGRELLSISPTNLPAFDQQPVADGFVNVLGGPTSDSVLAIITDAQGNVYQSGTAQGTVDFDPGPAVVERTLNAGSTYVAKYGPDGSLAWVRTMTGGSFWAMDVGPDGNLYLAGQSNPWSTWDGTQVDLGAPQYSMRRGTILKVNAEGDVLWARGFSGSDYEIPNDLEVADDGRVIVAGTFRSTADLDPGIGEHQVTSAGGSDIFLASLEATGDLAWVEQFGGTSADEATAVAVDAAGNICLAAQFNGTVDFDPGPGELKLSGISVGEFLGKFDRDGALLWGEAFQLPQFNDLEVGPDGSLYAAGQFAYVGDLAPGPEVVSFGFSRGTQDGFIARFDPQGSLAWACPIRGPGADAATALRVAGDGSVIVTGTFEQNLDFGTGDTSSVLQSRGGEDVFVADYTADGDFAWATSVGDQWTDRAAAVALSEDGHVIVAGSVSGTLMFDIGSVTEPIRTTGGQDLFLGRWTAAGDPLWIHGTGTGDDDSFGSVTVNPQGESYDAAAYLTPFDLDPGPGTCFLPGSSNGQSYLRKLDAAGDLVWARLLPGISSAQLAAVDDGFYVVGSFWDTTLTLKDGSTQRLQSRGGGDLALARFDGQGDLLWAESIGGPNVETFGQIATGSDGSLYVTGAFTGSIDLDPGPGTSWANSNEYGDLFVIRVNTDGTLSWARTLGAAGSEIGESLAIAADGTVYLGAYSSPGQSGDLDPSDNELLATSFNGVSGNGLLVKIDPAGNPAWAKVLPQAPAVTIAPDGGVFVSNPFSGQIDLDARVGVGELGSAGVTDVLVGLVEADGSLAWSRDLEQPGTEADIRSAANSAGGVTVGVLNYFPGIGAGAPVIADFSSTGELLDRWELPPTTHPMGLTRAADGSLLVAGLFTGSADFGSDEFQLQAVGSRDGFVWSFPLPQAPTGISLSVAQIAENQPAGTVVGSLTTADANAGDTFRYELVAGEGDSGNGSFTVTPDGVLSTAGSFDFESQSSYSIRLRSTDDFGLSVEQSLTINVADINEQLTVGDRVWHDFNANGLQDTGEPGIAGVLLHLYRTVDGVAGNADDILLATTVSYADGHYSLSPLAPGLNYYVTAELPERIAPWSFTAAGDGTAGSIDSDFGPDGRTAIFSPAVDEERTDLDLGLLGAQVPTAISLSESTVAEQQPAGTLVGRLATTDGDADERFTYRLADGEGSSDNSFFAISNDGQVTTAKVLDFEAQSQYSIRVRSTDKSGLWCEQSFVITTTDINLPPTGVVLTGGKLPPNALAGTIAGQLSTIDSEPPAGPFTYALVAGEGDSDNARFVVEGDLLKTASALDGTTPATLHLRIRVTDAAGGSYETPLTVDYSGGPDTVGVYDPHTANFFLRESASAGDADHMFPFGIPEIGWIPLSGDWDGDGVTTVGVYEPVLSTFYLTNHHGAGDAEIVVSFGVGGQGWQPLVGDWDGDGRDSIGIYEPSTSIFFLKNSLSSGNADLMVQFGVGSLGWKPITGDWDGTGGDGIGFYDPSRSLFFLKNALTGGAADEMFQYGVAGEGWLPLVGNWDGRSGDGIGLYVPQTGQFFLKNAHEGGEADLAFTYGVGGWGWKPLVGQWRTPPADPSVLAAAAATDSLGSLDDDSFNILAQDQVRRRRA